MQKPNCICGLNERCSACMELHDAPVPPLDIVLRKVAENHEYENLESVKNEISRIKNRIEFLKARRERNRLKAELKEEEDKEALRGPWNNWGAE